MTIITYELHYESNSSEPPLLLLSEESEPWRFFAFLDFLPFFSFFSFLSLPFFFFLSFLLRHKKAESQASGAPGRPEMASSGQWPGIGSKGASPPHTQTHCPHPCLCLLYCSMMASASSTVRTVAGPGTCCWSPPAVMHTQLNAHNSN